MKKYSSLVLRKLKQLVPMSVYSEISCFTFYDKHPRDTRNIDVTVCSTRGLVQEFYKREAVDSILIPKVNKVEEIELLRNTLNELFYLLASKNEIIILSRNSKTQKLEVSQRISNLFKYVYNDIECWGQPTLRTYRKRDALPLYFDENFENPREEPPSVIFPLTFTVDSHDLVKHLQTSLIEIGYAIKANDKALNHYRKLRQDTALIAYQKADVNSEGAIVQLDQEKISDILHVSVKPLQVKFCGKKIIIISRLHNRNQVPITDVAILLQHPNVKSFNYTTKLFNVVPTCPYWEEVDSEIGVDITSTIVALVDFELIENDTMKSINFDVIVSFNRGEINDLLPLGSVNISIADLLEDKFDILSEDEDTRSLLFAVISSSQKVKLCLRHIQRDNEDVLTMPQMFCTYLNMETLDTENVVIQKKFKDHILYGVMVLFEESEDPTIMNIQVYSRSNWQVLAVINYLYDAVPHKIIVTTPEYKLTGIADDLVNYKDASDEDQTNLSLETVKECSHLVLKQMEMIKEYIRLCTDIMLQSEDEAITNRATTEIRLGAPGDEKYREFRNSILNETLNLIKILSTNKKTVQASTDACTDANTSTANTSTANTSTANTSTANTSTANTSTANTSTANTSTANTSTVNTSTANTSTANTSTCDN